MDRGSAEFAWYQGEMLTPFKSDERPVLIWVYRIASLVAILAVLAAIGMFIRKRDTFHATVLVATIPLLAYVFSRTWTGLLFTALHRAKRYVEGAEGEHRHEWYSFKGQRVRVFLDGAQRPWFALNEIAFILGVKAGKNAFRHYGPHEFGIPESAAEHCLSEVGLRRLIKFSPHPDANALGNWLEREVLRVLRNRREIQATNMAKQDWRGD
jgi:hypothetical protein